MTTETQMCDVCGKPVEFVGGTINPDGSITEEHLCGECWVAQQEQERDAMAEFVYTERDGIRLAHMIVDFYEMKDDFEASTDTDETTSVAHRAEELCKQMVSLSYDIVKATSKTERKETDMGNYKSNYRPANEAQERIKMLIDKEGLDELAGSGMCERIIKCLRLYKDLANDDHKAAADFKRCAVKRIESVVLIGSSTFLLRRQKRGRVDFASIMDVVDTLLKDLDAYSDLDVYQLMDMYLNTYIMRHTA